MNKRTTFITAGAITGVLIAGSAAVGANIGILNAADNGSVGDLNASVAVTTAPDTVPTSVEPQVIDVYLEDPAVTTPATTAPPVTAPAAVTQQFAVDDAGTVSVRATDTGVLLDGVVIADGWTWTASQTAQGLEVTFTSADSEYVFYASLAEDGTIAARVDEPIVNIVRVPAAPAAPAPSQSNSTSSGSVATGQYGEHDDHEDEPDEHDEHDEHEGGEDDD